MFYCDGCAEKTGWPTSFLRSLGSCELCDTLDYCSDVPSRALPPRKDLAQKSLKKLVDATQADLVEGGEFGLRGGGVVYVCLDGFNGVFITDGGSTFPREDLYELIDKIKTMKFPVDEV